MGEVERELASGDRLGRYQLVSAIGAGGMGRVWVALDTAAPALRLVAVKTALRGLANQREFWALLSDEAALASRIQHPNVCGTYELGDSAFAHYLVMEWSDGASLRDLLDALPTHRLEPALAAHVLGCVAAGLHAAHELVGDDGHSLAVVHRDVSPQNVLISMRGNVRLADFGVAKARGQAHRPTETGEVKGKLSYLSPEQIASKQVDRRADVFALGCVLYETLLGVRPFHGNDALATMYKILEQPVAAPTTLDPAFPVELERIIMKALSKASEDRYETALEFRQSLLEYLASLGRYVGDKHVAEALQAALGNDLRARNHAIMQVADRLRRGETDPAKLRSPAPPPPQRSLTAGGIERTISALQGVPAVRRSPWPALAGIGLLAAAAALFVDGRSAHSPAVASKNPIALSDALQVVTAESIPSRPRPVAQADPSIAPSAAPPAPSAASGPTAAPAAKRASAARSNAPAGGAPSTWLAARPAARSPRPLDYSNPFVIQ